MTNTPTPPPGSPEAVALGCLCPVLDNCYGLGVVVTLHDSDRRIVKSGVRYWRNSACPLHGHGAPDADAQGGE